jgi:hypothetical protein
MEEDKKRLISQEHKHDSVLQLTMGRGFNSKSSFNVFLDNVLEGRHQHIEEQRA